MLPQPKYRGWLARKLAKARALTGAEWGFLIRGFLLLPAVALGMRVLPFHRVVVLLRGNGNAAGKASIDPDRAAYLVEVASRLQLRKPTCLQKALVLYGLLRRQGVEADLVIGAKKAEEKLAAHAWLEHQGRIILGGNGAGPYAPLLSLDAGGALAKRVS